MSSPYVIALYTRIFANAGTVKLSAERRTGAGCIDQYTLYNTLVVSIAVAFNGRLQSTILNRNTFFI